MPRKRRQAHPQDLPGMARDSYTNARLAHAITAQHKTQENIMSATLLIPIVLFAGGIWIAIAITNIALRHLASNN